MGKHSPKKLSTSMIVLIIVGALLMILSAGYMIMQNRSESGADNTSLIMPGGSSPEPLHEPELTTTDVAGGYNNIWDMVFVDDNTLLFDERGGKLHGVRADSKETWEITTIPNVWAEGEGGLTGLAKDIDFATNKLMYACYNTTGRTKFVKVARFKLSDDFKSISEFKEIIPNIQSAGGRHSGCRMSEDKSGNLWVGTGDSAIPSAAQDPKSLAGKLLRVNREGQGVEGNAGAPFDNRIYNFGHRNIQGIAMLNSPLDNGALGIVSEHGTDSDDEINWIMPGNYGWDPRGDRNKYEEQAPMTDKNKYPDAIEAIWKSGNPTIAVSGMTFLTKSKWSEWRGWVAMAALKGKQVKVLLISGDGSVKDEKTILQDFGRIRAAVEGPDGDLFISTDNGKGQDKIVRVTPK